MNLFQAANGAATFLVLSALVAGLAKHFEVITGSPLKDLLDHPHVVYLGLFIIIFRIKTFLDDHKHFAEPYQDQNIFRYIGFVLAILSWVFWGIAAYLLSSTIRASELMVASIVVSTMWVVVHVVEILTDPIRRNQENVISLMREKWVLVNAAYILCLGGHIGWFQPLIAAGARTPLIVLLVLLILDVMTSRSFKDLLKSDGAASTGS